MKNVNRHRDPTLAKIAKEVLFLETLKTRKSSHHDFHEHAVWNIKEALEAAYDAGAKATHPQTQ